jgi:hypothetical protein
MIIDTDSNCTKQVPFQRGVEAVGRYYAAGKDSKVITEAEARGLVVERHIYCVRRTSPISVPTL